MFYAGITFFLTELVEYIWTFWTAESEKSLKVCMLCTVKVFAVLHLEMEQKNLPP